jgi:hypothetical protein
MVEGKVVEVVGFGVVCQQAEIRQRFLVHTLK